MREEGRAALSTLRASGRASATAQRSEHGILCGAANAIRTLNCAIPASVGTATQESTVRKPAVAPTEAMRSLRKQGADHTPGARRAITKPSPHAHDTPSPSLRCHMKTRPCSVTEGKAHVVVSPGTGEERARRAHAAGGATATAHLGDAQR